MKAKKLRPTLLQVCLQLFGLVLLLFSVRWFLFEPFTVPSGSMFPNLMINDYILVNKMSAGIKIPFVNYWLLGPRLPKRGQVVVFWSVKNNAYFVKRLVGLPGDKLLIVGNEIKEINGHSVTTQAEPNIWNDKLKSLFPLEDARGETSYIESYTEVSDMGVNEAILMYSDSQEKKKTFIIDVPNGKLFFMGDHRSASSDSRVWGFVDVKDLVGPIQWILFSCSKKNISTQFCDPSSIRWDRFLYKVNR